MKKQILILLVGFCLLSCSDENKIEKLTEKIQLLQNENDSLKTIVSEINEKYIFDNVAVRTIPSYKNTDKLNSESVNEIVFIGYNDNGNSRIMFDNPEKTDLKYSDTLKMENGAFILERKLTKEKNFFSGKVETQNKFGKIYGTSISIGVLAH